MKSNDILKKLEEVAPVALSDEFCKKYSMYDNSGIIIDCGTNVTGALFSLDLSKGAVEEAKARGFNLIVTHHPAIYGGVSRINSDDPIALCIKRGISVISMHLNFDAAPHGIDFHLMKGLGGSEAQILCQLSDGGYGRVYSVQSIRFGEYLKQVKNTFSARTLGYGSADKQITKVASFCGAGCDDNAINFAIKNGADVFVSSDLKHHEIAGLLQKGINVIHLTHYSAENYGFNKIYNQISAGLGVPSAYFTDENLI